MKSMKHRVESPRVILIERYAMGFGEEGKDEVFTKIWWKLQRNSIHNFIFRDLKNLLDI